MHGDGDGSASPPACGCSLCREARSGIHDRHWLRLSCVTIGVNDTSMTYRCISLSCLLAPARRGCGRHGIFVCQPTASKGVITQVRHGNSPRSLLASRVCDTECDPFPPERSPRLNGRASVSKDSAAAGHGKECSVETTCECCRRRHH